MIHTLFIEPGDTFLEIKKKFRKCLMTGGGVLRLREGLNLSELEGIEKEFVPHIEPNGIAEEVVKQFRKRRENGTII